ncbi:hypothetical protein M0802_010663 [Mischocyttarus mexicanus]|nr:hypothetical protein M0802_010663 [Mischocyttarus mexicanus]
MCRRGAATEDMSMRKSVNGMQRAMSVRVCCAYRTTFFHAAMMIAVVILLHHLASFLAEAFWANWAGVSPHRLRAGIGTKAKKVTIVAWKGKISFLGTETLGERVRQAIARHLDEWIKRPASMGPTFHATQLMTRHGSFPAYLKRIGRVYSARCFHCAELEDFDAGHTLTVCPVSTCYYGRHEREKT